MLIRGMIFAGAWQCNAPTRISGSLTLAGNRCRSLWLQCEREPEALDGIPSETLGTRKGAQGHGIAMPDTHRF
ncbi:MAG: hypothetical protein VKL39_06740 [Leptolyngbyaceae bacterium]|nr:hypothetical protein [Leptolyngbyaceae bacterium]